VRVQADVRDPQRLEGIGERSGEVAGSGFAPRLKGLRPLDQARRLADVWARIGALPASRPLVARYVPPRAIFALPARSLDKSGDESASENAANSAYNRNPGTNGDDHAAESTGYRAVRLDARSGLTVDLGWLSRRIST
jgi:hypothetical protein